MGRRSFYINNIVKFQTKCYSMNNTNNNYGKDTYKAGEGSRMSQNVQQEFVNKELWGKIQKAV